MTTEITSINVNMDFDINLYQAAIKSNKHANFNISPRWRFGWCQYDFLPFVPCVKLLQSSTFAEKNELLRRKVADLVRHPIVLRTSRNRICCLTFLTWFWAYHFSKLHKAARKPNLRHRYRFWIFTGQGIVLVSALWRGLVLNYPASKAAERVQISGQKNSWDVKFWKKCTPFFF